jgi:hypothetical protein
VCFNVDSALRAYGRAETESCTYLTLYSILYLIVVHSELKIGYIVMIL